MATALFTIFICSGPKGFNLFIFQTVLSVTIFLQSIRRFFLKQPQWHSAKVAFPLPRFYKSNTHAAMANSVPEHADIGPDHY
jgi:hypothetical protein